MRTTDYLSVTVQKYKYQVGTGIYDNTGLNKWLFFDWLSVTWQLLLPGCLSGQPWKEEGSTTTSNREKHFVANNEPRIHIGKIDVEEQQNKSKIKIKTSSIEEIWCLRYTKHAAIALRKNKASRHVIPMAFVRYV